MNGKTVLATARLPLEKVGLGRIELCSFDSAWLGPLDSRFRDLGERRGSSLDNNGYSHVAWTLGQSRRPLVQEFKLSSEELTEPRSERRNSSLQKCTLELNCSPGDWDNAKIVENRKRGLTSLAPTSGQPNSVHKKPNSNVATGLPHANSRS